MALYKSDYLIIVVVAKSPKTRTFVHCFTKPFTGVMLFMLSQHSFKALEELSDQMSLKRSAVAKKAFSLFTLIKKDRRSFKKR